MNFLLKGTLQNRKICPQLRKSTVSPLIKGSKYEPFRFTRGFSRRVMNFNSFCNSPSFLYSLTEPIITPLTKYFCRKGYTHKIGKTESTMAAICSEVVVDCSAEDA